MVLSRLAAVFSLAALSTTATALRSRRAEDPCACKNWKQTYATTAVRCGETNEFYPGTNVHSLSMSQVEDAWESLGEQFCGQFYQAMDDNACVNVNIDSDHGQWCYVDAACSNLTGGMAVNEQLSWKMCTEGQDKMLRHYSPPELFQLAKDNKLELGLTNKMAYTLSPYKWKYISAFWKDADLDYLDTANISMAETGMTAAELKDYLLPRWGKRHRDIDEEMAADLQKYKDSGLPVTFDTAKDKHPPHVIIQGESVYIVLPRYPAAMVCLTGCKK